MGRIRLKCDSCGREKVIDVEHERRWPDRRCKWCQKKTQWSKVVGLFDGIGNPETFEEGKNDERQ